MLSCSTKLTNIRRRNLNSTGKINNQRATGVDGVPRELLKYSADAITNELVHILNEALTSECDIGLGSELVIPLPKPGKPPGPLTHLYDQWYY